MNYYYYKNFVWSFIQYLDFDNLPETNFTCAGKVIGGYYADLETSCQMFHVCTIGQLDEPMDIKFLCLNGTVFDQETRVCERVEEVDCPNSEKFYDLNLQLYGNTMLPQHEGNNWSMALPITLIYFVLFRFGYAQRNLHKRPIINHYDQQVHHRLQFQQQQLKRC